MTGQRIPGAWAQIAFRIVAAAALLSAFAQLTLGGVVRVTGSGLGCPDWPLCHGRVVPPFDTATLIEYSHRLSGSALGLLVIAVVVLAWTFYRSRPWVLAPSIFGLVMVVIAGILGGITVLTDLAWWVRLLHLGARGHADHHREEDEADVLGLRQRVAETDHGEGAEDREGARRVGADHHDHDRRDDAQQYQGVHVALR